MLKLYEMFHMQNQNKILQHLFNGELELFFFHADAKWGLFLKCFMAWESPSHNSIDFSPKDSSSNQPTFIIKFVASNVV